MKTPNAEGLRYVPFSPITSDAGLPVVETAPVGPIRDASQGGMSESKAGKRIQSMGRPEPVFFTPVAFPYLRDLVPNTAGQGRMVQLQAPTKDASMTTVAFSYEELELNEVFPNLGNEPPFASQVIPSRDHAAYIRFGSGGANHHLEIDCTEGNAINVPGSVVEVTLIEWTFYRELFAIFGGSPRLFSRASASALPKAGESVYTTRVLTFYQVEVDLLNPPTLEQHLQNLIRAVTQRVLLD